MFAQRYFAPRMFAPRYFDEAVQQFFSVLFQDASGVSVPPLAETWYNVDVAFGGSAGSPAATYQTTLSCPGATIDTAYQAQATHIVPLPAGAVPVNMGWSPNGRTVYLRGASPYELAQAFWRIQFPAPGSYNLTFSALGTIPVTVPVTPAAGGSAAWAVTSATPLGRVPARAGTVSYTSVYPAGGLSLPRAAIGLAGLLSAIVSDTAAYRFRWANDKLQVFAPGSSTEVTGVVSFSTPALFIGIVG